MKIALIFLLSLFIISCSSTPERSSSPKKETKPTPIKSSKNTQIEKKSAPILNADNSLSAKIKSAEAIADYKNFFQLCEEPLVQNTKEAELCRLKGTDIIETKLKPEQLDTLADDYGFSLFRTMAYNRLGNLALEDKDYDDARKYYSRSAAIEPASEWSQQSKDLLAQLEAARRVESKTIGVVLPMTGKYTSISQKTLRGIQMGLGIYNNLPSSFKLAIVDSEGNPDNARRGVERLVKEDNVIAVIGSLLSKTAPAVAAKTSELGVPSLALSQKSGITETGPSTFRNSLTSEMQVRYLVKTAMENLGMKKFAILYPNDAYGVEFTNLFWDEVLARGGSVVAVQTYSNKETDFREVIQRLVGTYYIEARSDEYKQRLKEWSDSLGKKSARQSPPEDLLSAIVDFDGIFIPDSTKALGQISAMLSYNGVKNVKLLGTNLWNTADVAKRAGFFSNNVVFVDSFVPADPQFATSSFVRDYRNLFGEDPGIFEIQGYDAALLLRQLISEGYSSRESLSGALAKVKDFPGSLGLLSITPEREILRPIKALTLMDGKTISLESQKTQ